jgi:3-phenylpropionate/trans-cinnamate dioxygenase ferredoxin reductase component
VADRAVDVLLVGGGVAASTAAQELRAQGFDGSVLLVGRELDPPYERPPLSKSYLLGRSTREDALLPVPDDVEALTRTSVMKLDPGAREARLSTKETVAFRHAILATGANVRRLPFEGADLERIHYLRALRNADALRADAEGAGHVGIVGGSFIACEVAASLAQLGVPSTLVFPEEEPLALQFGTQVGAAIRALLSEHGVEVLAGEQVARLEGDGAAEGAGVAGIACASGRTVECGSVLVAVGVVPDVMLARQAGLELGERGGVLCSSSLETSARGVFAAGDICEYDSVVHGRPVRIEHYEVAAGQGRCAARNVLGAGEPYTEVPYFWSDLADWLTLESVGPAVDGWDDEEVRGSLDEREFSVFYRRGGRLVAAVTAGRGADLDEAREELARATSR